MKKKFKGALSLLLCMIMVFGALAVGGEGIGELFNGSRAEAAEYSVGDIITFGSYPQSEVTKESDSATYAKLEAATKNWISYGYYSGDGSYGSMQPGDWMKYADITLEDEKYRAIRLTEYRPYLSESPNTSTGSFQDDNGYKLNIVYYFKYEPLRWRILDPNMGLVLSEKIIDAQAYSDAFYYSNESCKHYCDAAYTKYANNYAESSIRTWLNNNFYDTAFTSAQKQHINITALDNNAFSSDYSKYGSASTSDRIFLLSYNEARNSSYSFTNSVKPTDTRKAIGTDYAKAQGLYVSDSDKGSQWRLRSAADYSGGACYIDTNGLIDSSSDSRFTYSYFANRTDGGIRPALRLSNLSDGKFEESNYKTGDIITFGLYPQSEVKDRSTVEELNAASKNWVSYGYYSGNGSHGSMKPGDWMEYADMDINGDGANDYRAVRFSKYRPWDTESSTSSDGSRTFQDDNGYKLNTIYYFKYEPLKWRVLDPKEGVVLSESIIDSQAYSNTIYSNSKGLTNDAAGKNYANDYATSSIRKWLNEDFYSTAFTSTQDQNILPTTLDNKALPHCDEYDSASTTDKVFLLSYSEVQNTSYGFANNGDLDDARKAMGTDYAKSQGLFEDSVQYFTWRLRTASSSSGAACRVYYSGYVDDDYVGSAHSTYYGIRPAMRLADLDYSEPTPDGMRVIINNTSLSYVKGEEFIIALSNFKDNVENHIDKLAVMVSNTQILKVQGIYDYSNLPESIQKDEDLKKCKFIYLKAIGIGSSTVKMTDSDTKITREIPITVSEDTIATLRANEIKTYEYKAWFERDYYNANCDGIWVSDFKCSETTGGWNFSMNLYNENYCCGVLEVYDAQGKLIDVEIIDKFESLTKGIYKTFKAGYTIVRDAIDGDSLSFRSDATSKNTEIKDLFVPQNGHIAVTADSSVSVNCAVTNTFDMLFTSWTLAGDISEFMTNISTLSNDQVKQITKAALAKMIVQSEYLKYGEKLQEKFCEEAAKRVSLTAINSFSSKLFKSADILLDELNLSLNDIVKLALGSGVSIVESVFMKCSGPYGYVLKGMFLFQDACDLLTEINDAGKRLVGDGKFGCYTPLAGTELTTIKNGNVTIDTNGNTESGTVLESYMIKAGPAFVNKINDMVGQEKTSDEFQIYEISLHNRGKKVQPKGIVKVYIDSPYRYATVYRRNDDGSWEIIKSTVKNGVIEFEVDHFCRFAIISYPTISINTPSVTTVSYGFTLNLHANVTDLPEGAGVVWSMDGSGFKLIPSADGMTCGVKSVSKGSATITAKVVDKNGNAVKDANGNEITASQQLTSKAGFFQKLVAFFKKLFGSNMVIPSSLNKLIK